MSEPQTEVDEGREDGVERDMGVHEEAVVEGVTSPGNSAYVQGEGGQVTVTPSGPASGSFDHAFQSSAEVTGDDVKDEREIGRKGVGQHEELRSPEEVARERQMAEDAEREAELQLLAAAAEASAQAFSDATTVTETETETEAEEDVDGGGDGGENDSADGATTGSVTPTGPTGDITITGPTTGPEREPEQPGGGDVPPSELLKPEEEQ